MKKIILDAKKMTSKNTTHKYLKDVLDLPEYYGENLDALWDCLTEISEDISITIENADVLEENLGEYALQIISLFEDLIEQCDNYKIKFK